MGEVEEETVIVICACTPRRVLRVFGASHHRVPLRAAHPGRAVVNTWIHVDVHISPTPASPLQPARVALCIRFLLAYVCT